MMKQIFSFQITILVKCICQISVNVERESDAKNVDLTINEF